MQSGGKKEAGALSSLVGFPHIHLKQHGDSADDNRKNKSCHFLNTLQAKPWLSRCLLVVSLTYLHQSKAFGDQFNPQAAPRCSLRLAGQAERCRVCFTAVKMFAFKKASSIGW